MTDHLSREDFWKRLDDVKSGFLGLESGRARPVPMSHFADPEAGALWFITAKGTDIAEALGASPASARYMIASESGKIYARIDGRASEDSNPAKLDELWNAVADSWFEGGKRDDDIVLVRFDITEAEVWLTPGALGFLYGLVKAQTTDETPDMGAHGTLRFDA